MSGPPGHIPGYHLPGTLIPIGAVVAQQQAAVAQQQAAAAQMQTLLLLILRP
jgi:hypothetical protein